MLTVREALELPVFVSAKLVAGDAGLENAIRWVHIIDIPDLDDVAGTLAGLLQRSVTIEDPAFYILATAQYGPVDVAPELSLEHGRSTPELTAHLFDVGCWCGV